jgi:hypothetical protein
MHHVEHFEFIGAQSQSLRLGASSHIRVTQGRLWITAEGKAEDVWLQMGDSWTLTEPLKVWLSADPVASFAVLRPGPKR